MSVWRNSPTRPLATRAPSPEDVAFCRAARGHAHEDAIAGGRGKAAGTFSTPAGYGCSPLNRFRRCRNPPIRPFRASTPPPTRFRPTRPEADGTFAWDSTTLIVVHVEAGNQSGLGYTYADASVAPLIETIAKKALEGQDCFDIPRCRAGDEARGAQLRPLGTRRLRHFRPRCGALGPQGAHHRPAAGDPSRPLPRRGDDLRQRRLHHLFRREAARAAFGVGSRSTAVASSK